VWGDDVDRVDAGLCGWYVTVDGRGVEAAGACMRHGECRYGRVRMGGTRGDLELVVDKSVWLYRNNETVEGSPFVKTSKTTMSWASRKHAQVLLFCVFAGSHVQHSYLLAFEIGRRLVVQLVSNESHHVGDKCGVGWRGEHAAGSSETSCRFISQSRFFFHLASTITVLLGFVGRGERRAW
jgi:hypothetical protein